MDEVLYCNFLISIMSEFFVLFCMWMYLNIFLVNPHKIHFYQVKTTIRNIQTLIYGRGTMFTKILIDFSSALRLKVLNLHEGYLGHFCPSLWNFFFIKIYMDQFLKREKCVSLYSNIYFFKEAKGSFFHGCCLPDVN